jgi:hypothetical protein
MAFRVALPNFSKGELAPALYARVDVAAYSAAAKRARNVIILRYGGLTMRPGTRYVGDALQQDQPGRLIDFQFSIQQTYALELAQASMRPIALGGQVTEDELTITGITNEAQAAVGIPLHAYSVGDFIFLKGVQGMTNVNNRVVRVVAVIDANTVRTDLNTIASGTFTGCTGGITRTSTPTPPPSPPSVPPPVDPPAPPPTTGGGGGGGSSGGGGGGGFNPIP